MIDTTRLVKAKILDKDGNLRGSHPDVMAVALRNMFAPEEKDKKDDSFEDSSEWRPDEQSDVDLSEQGSGTGTNIDYQEEEPFGRNPSVQYQTEEPFRSNPDVGLYGGDVPESSYSSNNNSYENLSRSLSQSSIAREKSHTVPFKYLSAKKYAKETNNNWDEFALDKSRNRNLAQVAAHVLKYNAYCREGQTGSPSPSTLKHRKLYELDRLMVEAGTWLTSKRPTDKSRNQLRWDALRDLISQVQKEVEQLGSRMLQGPADFKHIKEKNRSSWLERLDPKHRAGYQLSAYYEEWLRYANSKNFFEWVEYVETRWDTSKGPRPLNVATSEVKYLGHQQARKYEVRLKWQMLFDLLGRPVDTRRFETVDSGPGWGIFVCDATTLKLYIGDHDEGRFHHSSFLGGKPVLAAGEICVDQGRVVMINAQSGHYRPTVRNMRRFLKTVPTLSNVLVCPEYNVPRAYFCDLFLSRGLEAPVVKKATLLRVLPLWAQKGHGIRNLLNALQ